MLESHLPVTIAMIINQNTEPFLRRSRGCIRVASLISEANFEELVDVEVPELEKIKIEYKKKVHEEDGFTLWNYAIGREIRGEQIRGSFLALQKDNFVFLITGYSPSFLRNCIMYIAKQLYPDIMVAYITTEEINEILSAFSEKMGIKLFYSKYVAKKVFGERETALGYGHKIYTDAFKKALEAHPRLWIDSINVFSENNIDIEFRLGRQGKLTYHKGNFQEYYEHVLSKIADYSAGRLKIFENRGRRETEKKEVHPLLIQYNSRVFEEQIARKQLIDVISDYDFCNFAVIHNGNPHVYLNIVDRVDNSTFSLRTYGTDSLVIAPQVKTSRASLMRFSKHLQDRFQEGKVSEFQTQ
jgi:imidazoleglycerol phosphate dehydratase HisB